MEISKDKKSIFLESTKGTQKCVLMVTCHWDQSQPPKTSKTPTLSFLDQKYSVAILSYPSNGQRQTEPGTANPQNSFGTFQFTYCSSQLGTTTIYI